MWVHGWVGVAPYLPPQTYPPTHLRPLAPPYDYYYLVYILSPLLIFHVRKMRDAMLKD